MFQQYNNRPSTAAVTTRFVCMGHDSKHKKFDLNQTKDIFIAEVMSKNSKNSFSTYHNRDLKDSTIQQN